MIPFSTCILFLFLLEFDLSEYSNDRAPEREKKNTKKEKSSEKGKTKTITKRSFDFPIL